MRVSVSCRLALLTACVCVGLMMAISGAPAADSLSIHRERESPSADFLDALRTANAFLWAWVSRDAENGYRLMSERLRAQVGDESWLKQFVVGLSNPHHHAFEIGTARKQGANRFVFPVTLYELYTGEPKGTTYSGRLEIVREGQTWRVDRLPKSADNP
jgi:hypothetical protein